MLEIKSRLANGSQTSGAPLILWLIS